MKRAPIIFLAALGIFLSAIAASQRSYSDDEMKKVSLDFSGISALEIHSNQNANITIQDDAGPSMSYSNLIDPISEEESKVQVIRKNNVLLIKAELTGYQGFDIVVPSSVRKMVVSEANINTNMNLEAMDITAQGSGLNWSGNVKSLNIRSHGGQAGCEERYCEGRVNIYNGVIDQLSIVAKQGEVILDRTQELKATRLRLGPDVRLSISNASSIKNIQFEEYDAKQAMEVAPVQ